MRINGILRADVEWLVSDDWCGDQNAHAAHGKCPGTPTNP